MKPMLKLPGTLCTKMKCDILLSTSAFKINLHRYTKDGPNTPLEIPAGTVMAPGRALHSSTFRLNAHFVDYVGCTISPQSVRQGDDWEV
jgi:hypothetical protein